MTRMTAGDGSAELTESFLAGIRVVELADERAEYCGKVLAGLGADVIKIEPPQGEHTRTYGPFKDDRADPNQSLYFWHYNFGKRGVVADLTTATGQDFFRRIIGSADVLLTSWPRDDLAAQGLDDLSATNPRLIAACVSPFGDSGPWSKFVASDLVHLALGGVAMNCGYDPEPSGHYDLPPIAPQMWQAYHISGEHAAMAIIAALYYRLRTGVAQELSVAVHQAVSTNTETDVPDWIFQRLPHLRQTCRHSRARITPPNLARTKDGRWLLPYRTYLPSVFFDAFSGNVELLVRYGMAAGLDDGTYVDPSSRTDEVNLYIGAATDRLVERFTYSRGLWLEAQGLGLPWAPCRRPEENIAEEHWSARKTFFPMPDEDSGRVFTHVGAKWLAPEVPWRVDRVAPRLGEHTDEVLAELSHETGPATADNPDATTDADQVSPRPFDGVRILDLSWLLASAGGGRYLSSLGAEVIKVEHETRIDAYRYGAAQAPAGGRAARDLAQEPLPPSGAGGPNRSGAFMEINAGKRAISLNLKTERGRELLRELVTKSDVVVEGFSPGTMDRMGLGYPALRALNPRIVYVQQSGMGQIGTYGRMRSYGPTAQALTGISDMSGLPDPYPPAGIGYSYLDWFGAYNVAMAMLAGLYRQRRTGPGCWIDSSQAEAGIYLTGTAVLDHSVNGRAWSRYGNRSPYKAGAPHGIYPARGEDRWIAISCFTEEEWRAAATALGRSELADRPEFRTLKDRLAHQDLLDEEISTLTSSRDRYELMETLQATGVPAGACQNAEDRCETDPQLRHLRWMVELPQTEIGTWPVKDFPVSFSETPAHMGGALGRSGPCYGEDNDYVYGHVLGLSHDEIVELRTADVI